MSVASLTTFVCLFFAAAVSALPVLPSITVSGTPFEVGQAIGTTFRAQFAEFVATYPPMDSVLIPFSKTDLGRQAVAAFFNTTNTLYPAYIQEMQGLSNGSGISWDLIWLLNIREEIALLASCYDCFDHMSCSDVLVNTGSFSMIGHNEDNDIQVGPGAFWQTTSYTDSNLAAFAAYTYPTLVAGNAFGMNEYGVVVTVNALSPKDININGVPRQVLGRDVFNAKSISDALNRLNKYPSACGFSMNIGDAKTQEVVNVEVAPGSARSLQTVTNGHYYHFNEYLRLNTSQYPDISSEHRIVAANNLSPAVNRQDTINILGDQSDAAYPIYRTNTPPDEGATLASALFDLTAARVDIFCFTNPKSTTTPLLSLPIPRPQQQQN